jgi:hypothetical protein
MGAFCFGFGAPAERACATDKGVRARAHSKSRRARLWGMIKLMFSLVVLAGTFGAGFYYGMQYQERDFVENPGKIAEVYAARLKEGAKGATKEVAELLQRLAGESK